MFVLTAEGGQHLNRGLWCTHVVLGVFPTKGDATRAADAVFKPNDEHNQLLFLTNMDTKEAFSYDNGFWKP